MLIAIYGIGNVLTLDDAVGPSMVRRVDSTRRVCGSRRTTRRCARRC